MPITLQNLKDVGIKAALQNDVLTNVNAHLDKYKINTPLRIAHFMAQVCHESGGFTIKTENMKYTNPHRLMVVWPKRFPTLAKANEYINNAQKLANYVYANRMGNGPAESNDGYSFRGRGPMQTTGRESYGKMSKKIFGDDRLLTNPDLLGELQYGIQSAFIEWNDGKCNTMADADDIRKITKYINGGFTGLDDRKKWLAEWKHTLNVG